MILHRTIGDLCNGYKAVIGYCEGELCRLEASPHRKYLQQDWDRTAGALAQYRRELEYWSKQDPDKKNPCFAIPTIVIAYAGEIMRRDGYEV